MRSRNFCFTFNNYPNTELVDSIECKYIAYAEEVGESGTPHLQGFVTFYNKKSVQQVIDLMPGCHISIMKGSILQNEVYCAKQGTLVERGEKPMSKNEQGELEKQRWNNARDLAKIGLLDDIDADIYVKYYSSLKNIAKDHQIKPGPEDVKAYWIYGPTGTGKSHCVETSFPNCYKKAMDDLKWFDGYQDQDVVYLEDIDKYQVKWGGLLKRLADRWPMQASIKGTMKYIRPKVVIVTSNYCIEEIWSDSGTVDPLLRRFKQILKTEQNQVIDFD